jgi:hypothetical protein
LLSNSQLVPLQRGGEGGGVGTIEGGSQSQSHQQYLLNGKKVSLAARGDKLVLRGAGGGSADFLDWLGRNRAWERGAGAGPPPPWRS